MGNKKTDKEPYIDEKSRSNKSASIALDLAFPFEVPDSSIAYPLIIEQAFPEIYQSAQQIFNQYNSK